MGVRQRAPRTRGSLTRAKTTRVTVIVAAVIATVAVFAGCVQPTDSSDDPLRIGSSGTPAMRVMAEIYAGALRNSGADVASRIETGDDAALLNTMAHTDVDLFPALTGRLLGVLTPRVTAVTADAVYTELNRALPQGVSVGDPTPVSVAPQVFVATRVAEAAGATELTDCPRLPAGLAVVTVGEPDEGVLAALRASGCRFGPAQSVPSADAALRRVADGSAVGVLTPIEVAADRGAEANTVQALRAPAAREDGSAPEGSAPEGSAPDGSVAVGPRAEVLVPVYRSAALSRDDVKTINKVAGEITTGDLATMAARVQRGDDPRELAVTWLGEHGL